MDSNLGVVHTKTHDGKPLVTVRNLPGNDADLTPAQLRALAVALVAAADDCEAHAKQPKPRRGTLPPITRNYSLNAG